MMKKTDSGSVLMTLRKSPQLNPLPLIIRIRFCCNPLMIPQSLLSRVQRWKWTQWQAQWQAQCPQEHTCTQIPTTAINLQPCNSSAFLFQSSKTMVHGFRGLNMSFFPHFLMHFSVKKHKHKISDLFYIGKQMYYKPKKVRQQYCNSSKTGYKTNFIWLSRFKCPPCPPDTKYV